MRKAVLAGFAVSALLSGAAFAEDPTVHTGVDAMASEASTVAAPESGADATGAVDAQGGLKDIEPTSLVDIPVIDANGEQAGAVADVVLNAEDEPALLVIQTGGVLGLGSRKIAITAEEVDAPEGAEAVTLTGQTKAQMKLLPSFEYTAGMRSVQHPDGYAG